MTSNGHPRDTPAGSQPAGYWGAFDPEDALDFARAWIANTAASELRYQRTAAWLAERQAKVELLPCEPALQTGFIRLRHGTMQPEAFSLHAGQFFATGGDTGYGYAWSPGRPDGAVVPIDVPRSALLPASLNTPMPHARPGHDRGGLTRARRGARDGALWVINTPSGEVAALRAAAFAGVDVHPPIPAALIRARNEAELRRRRSLVHAGGDHADETCLLCGMERPRHEAGCPVPTRHPGAVIAHRDERRRAGLGL